MNKSNLKSVHRDAIIAILAANERVERVVLFGSRAMGTNAVTSDVDLALFGDQLSLTDLGQLAAGVELIPMAQTVDMVLVRAIQEESLLEHIRRQGIVWFEREEAVR